MKYIGALLLALAAASAGLYAAHNVRRRVELLEQCVCLVGLFSVGIGYGDEPIEVLTKRAAQSSEVRGLTFLCSELLSSINGDFSQRWSQSIDSFARGTPALNSSDIELLKSFGGKLGTTDSQRQLELCEMYRQRFSDSLAAAKGKQTERMRLFSVGGVAAGFLLFLLVI